MGLRRAGLKVVMDRLSDVRPRLVAISGGEPLLFPEILWLLRELSEHGLDTDVCTNGTAASPELVRTMAATVRRVSVSLDSFSREKSAILKRSPEASERALEAIDAFVAAGMQVSVSVVPTGITYEEIVATAQGLARRGVASISILPLMATRDTSYRLTPIAWKHLHDSLPRLIDVCRRYDVELKLKGFPLDEETMTRCGAGEHVVAISSTGHLWPCAFFGEDCDETDLMKVTIPEALASSSFERFRRDISRTACVDCEHASFCGKGCVGVSWVEQGVIAPDPRCVRKTLRSTDIGPK
jgi:radical SAM protein with 4Fe4S-binding SPASM domain